MYYFFKKLIQFMYYFQAPERGGWRVVYELFVDRDGGDGLLYWQVQGVPLICVQGGPLICVQGVPLIVIQGVPLFGVQCVPLIGTGTGCPFYRYKYIVSLCFDGSTETPFDSYRGSQRQFPDSKKNRQIYAS